jgi:hypothetical protein
MGVVVEYFSLIEHFRFARVRERSTTSGFIGHRPKTPPGRALTNRRGKKSDGGQIVSIINVGSEYPPGYTGNPYSALDISVFFDMNWPDHAGIMAQGSPAYSSGLGRLGQCVTDDNGDEYCPDSGSDDSGVVIPVAGNTAVPIPAAPGCATSTCIVMNQGVCTGYDDSSCSASVNATTAAALNNQLIASGLPQTVNLSATQTAALTASLTPAQQAQLIAAAGNSAVSLIRTAEGGPYTVAGTNLVYNPATGQLTTAAATNATATLTAGLSAIQPYIPMILLAVAAIIIVPMITGKK